MNHKIENNCITKNTIILLNSEWFIPLEIEITKGLNGCRG
jgi:hypothetical protein